MVDGRFPVKIKVGFGTGLMVGTGVSCLESEWSERTRMYSGPHASMVNKILADRLGDVLTVVLGLRDSGRLDGMRQADLRRILDEGDGPTVGEVDFQSIAEEYISVKNLSKSSVTSIRQTVRRVTEYAGGKVAMSKIDRLWLMGLERHIGGKVNSIAVHMRNIRSIFNHAISEKYPLDYPFGKYKIRTAPTDDRSLSVEELRQIFQYPCDPWQQEYVDMFKLIFCLCGINMADLARLDKIRGGRLEFNRAKTGVHCSMAVQPEAAEIIGRYRGRGQLLSIMDRYASHENYLAHLNDALKTLGTHWENGRKRTGEALFPDISSYWARYSWAGIAGELDIPIDTIGAAMGHAREKSVTAIYIRTDMRKKVDAANRKVLDYVFYGKDWREK